MSIKVEQNETKPIEETFPIHLDKWARNERLYKTLLNFGLYVEPVYDDFQDIVYLKVSTSVIQSSQDQG